MKQNTTIKIPNDLVDKYISLFSTSEQFQAVLDLIKQSYVFGYNDGVSDNYKEMME